jgi:hypothetical protein
MAEINFFAPNGMDFLKDAVLAHHAECHAWSADGAKWAFGVATPARGIDPNLVADMLTALGVTVLPGTKHPTPPDIPDAITTALSRHGVKKGDKTADIVQKMSAASGHPKLRPNYY